MPVQQDPSVDGYLDSAARLTAAEDYPGAEAVLAEAIGRYPEDPEVMVARARLATRGETWELAAKRWRATLDRHGDTLGVRAHTQAIRALRRNGEQAAAAELAETAVGRFPRNFRALGEGAQVAMANESWSAALVCWVRWHRARRLRAQRDLEPDDSIALPLQSGIGDWSQSAWEGVVAHLGEAAQMRLPPPPDFYLALLDVVRRADLDECEIDVLRHATGLFPDFRSFAYDLAKLRLRRGEQPERWPLDGDATAAFLRQFPPPPPITEGVIGPLRLITVRPGSAADLAVRHGHYFDHGRLTGLVQELSARDRWPELDSDVDLLLARARQLAHQFGSEVSSAVGLAPDVIADALILTLYQELALFVPVSRCAREIAAAAGDDPVVIECPGLEYHWLDGYTASDFDVLYLYFALLGLGCNVFLRRADDLGTPDATGFILQPGWRTVRSRLEVVPDSGRHSRVLAPAGIRSVAQVAAQLPDCLVLATGSVIQEFAYSNNSERLPITAGAHLCDGEGDLPTFTFPLLYVADVEGTDLDPSYDDDQPGSATFQQSENLVGTWWDWLFRATGARLRHLKEAAEVIVEERGIVEAHVADHMYTEPVILADAVRRAGGRVVLWPHSTNPVHTGLRRADSFDEVHAVTRSGVRIWREAFPDKPVHHTPKLMIRPDRKVSPVEGGPLSIVVFGGRPAMGDMPVLDVAAHVELYRAFFAGIADLQRQFDVNLWFKPRGRTGEHEQWLEGHVGSTGGWRPVYDHALQLELPNPLFVSISSGSSALLEGLSRDIPGMIVRDFAIPAWVDYTSVDPRTFPILSRTAAIDQISRAVTAAGYRDLIERERVFYESEFGV